ncbi:MAG: zinc ribbon domain-containing protein [Anaerolineales bacterium]|nr:zinc ribbon domain-containing protein [Anaerolineales bacterium]
MKSIGNCKYCGAPLDADMRFCEGCGRPAQVAPPPARQPQPVQPEYHPVQPPPVYRTPAEPAPAAPLPEPEPKGRGIGCYLGAGVIALGLVIMLAGAAIAWFSMRTSKDPVSLLPTAAPVLVQTEIPPTQEVALEPTLTETPFPTITAALTDTPTELPTEIPTETPTETATPVPTETTIPSPTATSGPILTGDQYLDDHYIMDDFSSDAFGWSVDTTDVTNRGYEEGGYYIHITDSNFWGMSWLPVEFTPRVVEFDARIVEGYPGGEYGVICNYQDSANYDFVGIDPETNDFVVARRVEDEFVYLDDPGWISTESLAESSTAVNHILVECYADFITVFIGDEYQGEWALDPPGVEQYMALYVYGWDEIGPNGFKVIFDNLEAWVPVQ